MGGEHFHLYVWAFCFVFSLFMMTIYPVVIMPMFNKYEDLPENDLKTRIYALAERISYPLQKLFVMDGTFLFILTISFSFLFIYLYYLNFKICTLYVHNTHT